MSDLEQLLRDSRPSLAPRAEHRHSLERQLREQASRVPERGVSLAALLLPVAAVLLALMVTHDLGESRPRSQFDRVLTGPDWTTPVRRDEVLPWTIVPERSSRTTGPVDFTRREVFE